MNNKKSNFLVRFLGNRNTVTFLGLVACVLTLVIGYYYRISESINPESIPYAKERIKSRTLITDKMVGHLRISGDYLSTASNVVRNANEVIGDKYASFKTSIPKGSLFYRQMLKTAEEMPDAAFANIPDGYTIFALDVTNDETFGGQIGAGDYIDLYASATTDTNENGGDIIFAKLIESIRVLAVKDTAGNNILKGSGGTPAQLLFAVPEDMFLLLYRASNVSGVSFDIFPVIRNHNYTVNPGETHVPLQNLEDFINQYVEIIGEE